MLVDDHVDQQAQPDGHLRHAVLGRGPGAAEGHHVAGDGAGPGGRPRDHDAAVVGFVDGRAQPGAAGHRRELELVAAGDEDAGDVFQLCGQRRIVGLLPGLGAKPEDLGHAHPPEGLAVQLGGDFAQAGGGAQDRDAGLAPAGEVDEAAQDDSIAQLVLRASDDHDRRGRLARPAGCQPAGVPRIVHWCQSNRAHLQATRLW